MPAAEGGDGVLRFAPPGGGCIELHGTEGFQARYGWRPPALPCFTGVEVRFASRAQAAQLMEGNGVPVQRRGGQWFVAPAHTNGFVLGLSQ